PMSTMTSFISTTTCCLMGVNTWTVVLLTSRKTGPPICKSRWLDSNNRSVCSVSSQVPGTCRPCEDDHFRTQFYQKEKHHEHPSHQNHESSFPNCGRNHYPLRRER